MSTLLRSTGASMNLARSLARAVSKRQYQTSLAVYCCSINGSYTQYFSLEKHAD